jgi:hypothetical protein
MMRANVQAASFRERRIASISMTAIVLLSNIGFATIAVSPKESSNTYAYMHILRVS